jgi:hypothetical protein
MEGVFYALCAGYEEHLGMGEEEPTFVFRFVAEHTLSKLPLHLKDRPKKLQTRVYGTGVVK